MARINDHYLKLRASYLFSETGRRTREFQAAHPDAKLIRLGIGDVTRPLSDAVIRAMHEAVDEMAKPETFRGYPPETGWDFLVDAIIRHDYGERGIKLTADEIVVSDGAREVAIEFRSFSKTAGFTGTRCAYTVVPKELQGRSATGEPVSINALWVRRQSTKFNGVAYVIQRAAAATYTPEGRKQVTAVVDYYMENARIIREGLEAAGLTVYGARNAPYIWVKTPGRLSSWDFFDKLLNEAHVVGTPGAGFGPSGEGYFRLTAFGGRPSTEEAVDRIKTRLAR